MRLFKSIPLFFALVLVTGCLETAGSGEQGVIPDVHVECSSAQVHSPYCQNTGEILWIGMSKNFDLDCAAILSSPASFGRSDYFDAIAENVTLTKSGYIVTADITSWTTPLGASVGTLPEGSYRTCSFIETSSGNNRLDNNEPYFSGFINVGGESPQDVNDWISY